MLVRLCPRVLTLARAPVSLLQRAAFPVSGLGWPSVPALLRVMKLAVLREAQLLAASPEPPWAEVSPTRELQTPALETARAQTTALSILAKA